MLIATGFMLNSEFAPAAPGHWICTPASLLVWNLLATPLGLFPGHIFAASAVTNAEALPLHCDSVVHPAGQFPRSPLGIGASVGVVSPKPVIPFVWCVS